MIELRMCSLNLIVSIRSNVSAMMEQQMLLWSVVEHGTHFDKSGASCLCV